MSMLPALTGGKPPRTAAYAEANRKVEDGGGFWRMVRADRWKYINLKNASSRRREERLYDLAGDPSELNDRAKSDEHAEVLQVMRRKMDKWLEMTPRHTVDRAR